MTKTELLAIIKTLKEFKRSSKACCGPKNKVYKDHQNLVQDALGFTSDRVYCWRLILEEYGPEIFYIKGIHNTVTYAICWLDFSSKAYPNQTDKQN